jgi:hypothetical protein
MAIIIVNLESARVKVGQSAQATEVAKILREGGRSGYPHD